MPSFRPTKQHKRNWNQKLGNYFHSRSRWNRDPRPSPYRTPKPDRSPHDNSYRHTLTPDMRQPRPRLGLPHLPAPPAPAPAPPGTDDDNDNNSSNTVLIVAPAPPPPDAVQQAVAPAQPPPPPPGRQPIRGRDTFKFQLVLKRNTEQVTGHDSTRQQARTSANSDGSANRQRSLSQLLSKLRARRRSAENQSTDDVTPGCKAGERGVRRDGDDDASVQGMVCA